MTLSLSVPPPEKDQSLPVTPVLLSAAILAVTVWTARQGLQTLLHHDVSLALTFVSIGVVAFVQVVRFSLWQPYSLQLVHWIYVLTFFFIAPVAQYGVGELPWGLTTNLEERLLPTNFLVLTWVAIWTLLAHPSRGAGRIPNSRPPWDIAIQWQRFAGMRIFLLAAAGAFVLEEIATKGVNGLFLRGAASDEATMTMTPLGLLINYAGRALPLALLVLVVTRQRAAARPLRSAPVYSALLIVLLTNFPFATARFWSALVVIGILATVGLLRRRWSLTATTFLGLGLALPVLGAARHALDATEFLQTLTSSENNQAWLTPDFDAYSVLTWTHEYVSDFGNTNGNQLLTALLFFVPRSIWPEKSVGSGYLVAHQINLPFDNVSNTLPAEGIINFGMLGMILFAVLSALACTSLDRRYWAGEMHVSGALLYPFLLGSFFFILRGDMLSSMSYTVGLVVPAMIVFTLARGRRVSVGDMGVDAEEGCSRVGVSNQPSPDVPCGSTTLGRPGSGESKRPRTGGSRSASTEVSHGDDKAGDTRLHNVEPARLPTSHSLARDWTQPFRSHEEVSSAAPSADGSGTGATACAGVARTETQVGRDATPQRPLPELLPEEASLPAPLHGLAAPQGPALKGTAASREPAGRSGAARVIQTVRASRQPLSYAGFMGIAQVLSMAFFLIVARRQGPSTTAAFMSSYVLAAFISTFIDFGESTNAVRILAASRGRFGRRYVRYAGARFLLCLTLTAAGLLVAQFNPFIGLALALGSMMSMQVFFIAAVRIRTGPARLAACFIIEKCISIAALYLIAPNDLSTYQPMYFLCIGLLANVLICMLYWPMKQILRSARPSRAAWYGGQHMGVATIINRVQLMDVAFLTACGPRSIAGSYAAVNRWSAPFNLYSQSVAQYMLPHYTAADYHTARGLLRRTNFLLAPASLVLVAVSFLSPVLVGVLLGPKFDDSVLALSVLCYASIAAMYASSYYVFVQARQLDHLAVRIYTISTIVQFALLWPAVHYMGSAGASFAFLAGQTVLMIGCRRLVAAHTDEFKTSAPAPAISSLDHSDRVSS